MLDRGYIRIPRLLFQSAEWKERRVYSHFEAILSLYEQAAYTNGRFVNSRGYAVSLERGQLVTTIRLLADLWGWSKSKTSRFLLDLRDSNRDTFRIKIETINGTSATIVTICNYDGNEDEVVINGTQLGTQIGTECGTAIGTLYKGNKEVIQYQEENTHNLISKFVNSCASVHKNRETTYALYCELAGRRCFEAGGECYNIGLGMRLIGKMWERFSTLQRRMVFTLTLHQANTICEKFDAKDIMRVLERMANTVDLEKKRKSVYHTLNQWLIADFEVKKKSEQQKQHVYPGKL